MDGDQTTYVTPPAGANAWAEPDPDAARLPRLGPGEPVEILETRGVWVRVHTATGREAWIDGRRLQALEPPEAGPEQNTGATPPPADTDRATPTTGSRRRWLVVGVTVAVLAAAVGVSVVVLLGGCGPDSGAPALPRVTDEALMHGADPGNTNDFGDNLAPSGPELVEYWCSQDENRFNTVSISAGLVYVNDEDRDRVVVLDARTGEVTNSYPGTRGDTALDDMTLYVAGSVVQGLDRASGAQVWAFTDIFIVHDPPVPAGDLVLVVESTGDLDTLYTLYALDASTGVPRWSQRKLDPSAFPTVGVNAGVVVFPEGEGILTFDLATGDPGPVYRGPVAVGVVVAGGAILFDGTEEGLTVLDLDTASLRWVSGQRARPAVAVDEGMALGVGWGDDRMLSMFAYELVSGTPIWRYSTGRSDRDALSRPTVAGGVAYFSIDSTIYAVELANGQLVWSADVGVNVWSDIVVANGLLVFGGKDGKVHAFGDR